jgi:superfamily II DNA/RNA helicase
MDSVFARFPPRLQEAIVSRLGWSTLRPVQELAGHALLDGQNAVILAPTAGGKTEAAMFPLLARLLERAPAGVGLLYIAPLRALLNGSSPNVELPCNKINGLCVVAVLVATNACQQNQIVTDSEVKMVADTEHVALGTGHGGRARTPSGTESRTEQGHPRSRLGHVSPHVGVQTTLARG